MNKITSITEITQKEMEYISGGFDVYTNIYAHRFAIVAGLCIGLALQGGGIAITLLLVLSAATLGAIEVYAPRLVSSPPKKKNK